MGPLRQPCYDGEYLVTTQFVTEFRTYENARDKAPVEFYDDVDVQVVREIQNRANEVLGDDDLELIDGYDFRG